METSFRKLPRDSDFNFDYESGSGPPAKFSCYIVVLYNNELRVLSQIHLDISHPFKTVDSEFKVKT